MIPQVGAESGVRVRDVRALVSKINCFVPPGFGSCLRSRHLRARLQRGSEARLPW